MKNKAFRDRYALVLTEDEIQRIKAREKNGKPLIIINLHEMKCCEARRTLNNIINLVIGPCVIDVIHGYRHGTAIREMIQTNLSSKRIQSRNINPRNPGETFLNIA